MTATLDETAVGEPRKPIVYTKNNCSNCESTKEQLQVLGVDFETRNVQENKADLKFVKSLGYREMPVVYLDDNNHWSGHKAQKIKENFDTTDPWDDGDDIWS